MIILALETSCDETAAAIIKNSQILASTVSSQIETHAQYGGVVPEVAARMHLEKIIPLTKETIEKAKIKPKQINAIAVTQGPGLLPSLMIGVDTAKALSFAWNKPLIAINHMEGHLYSGIHELKGKRAIFPLLALIVSGGHTEIVLMKDHGKYQIIGETLDDAAGEAFDKVGKLLGLPYPGGPEISRLAHLGNSKAYQFAKPLINKPNFDFSFSGLKTDVLRFVKKRKRGLSLQEKRNVAASFQRTVVEVLITKFLKAAKKYEPKSTILAGGVAANSLLRRSFGKELRLQFPKLNVVIPRLDLCTDNAIMIALAAERKYKRKDFANLKITAEPNLSF
jgi:N6-L-threonylcarbamoyladenine synthase